MRYVKRRDEGRVRPRMGPATIRRRLPRDQRRAEILRVATAVFYSKGYEAASLQDIADAMGIKKASLYYYFSSKEALLHAVLAEIIGKGIDNARRILALGGDPLTRLWRMVAGHIDHLCENLVETAVFLHERKRIPPALRREILAQDYAYQGFFIALITEGQAQSQIRPDLDPKLATLRILGSANWPYSWYRSGSEFGPDRIGAQFATMTVNSVASEEALRSWRIPDPPGSGKPVSS
jgi:AcrR family transcriptional regulator